jgi:serine/threonine protein kinase
MSFSPFRRIVKNQPLIPNHISKIAKDFILKLLMKNPKRRLGAKGLEDIKRHPFFGSDMDWDAIAQKRIPAPIKPKLKDEMDTSNFADEFTRLPITDSPGLAPPTESLFRVSGNFIKQFYFIVFVFNRVIHLFHQRFSLVQRMQLMKICIIFFV